MAERRMFHGLVVNSDSFLDLPLGAQALYFHLGMGADDDGFVNGPRQIARSLGLGQEALDALIGAGFLLWFDGIAVLRHWRMANSLKSDRVQLPRHIELAKKIYIGADRIYSLQRLKGMESLFANKKRLLESSGIRKDSQKKREEKKGEEKKIEEKSIEECEKSGDPDPLGSLWDADLPAPAPYVDNSLKLMGGVLGKGVILLSDREQEDLLDKLGIDGFDRYVAKLSDFITKNNASVNNHYATILKWWQEDKGGFL